MKFGKYKKELKNEFEETLGIKPKKKISIHVFLSPVYAMAALVIIFIAVIGFNYLYVRDYNNKAKEAYDAYYESYFNDDTEFRSMYKISNRNELSSFKNYSTNYKTTLYNLYEMKKNGYSPLTEPTGIQVDTYIPSDGSSYSTGYSSHGWFGGVGDGEFSHISTNNQEDGIDEADIAKCDGTYIYYCSSKKSKFIIYDLSGNIIVSQDSYVRDVLISGSTIVLICWDGVYVYSFNGTELTLKYEENHSGYIDARLYGDYAYVAVVKGTITFSTYNFEVPLYTDGISGRSQDGVYEIIRIDMGDYSVNQIYEAGSQTMVYMSESYMILSNYVYYDGDGITMFSVFDMDLNPVCAIREDGCILDQYSMDVVEDSFRFMIHNESSNLITIDLKNLKRTGSLLGIAEGEVIKSVSFTDDRCYLCTYKEMDPLFEIILTDPSSPYIASTLEAPGYSDYLYCYEVNGESYILGLGLESSNEVHSNKISLYKNGEDGLTQIGENYYITEKNSEGEYDFYYSRYLFQYPRELFLFENGTSLYLGVNLRNHYVMYEIDVTTSDIVSLYKEVETNGETRCFLMDGICYLPQASGLIITEF